MKQLLKFPEASNKFGTRSIVLQEITSWLCMVDQVDTKNQNYQFLEEACQTFEGNVMSSLHLTDVNEIRKDHLPTMENMENLLLDLMLEHSIDHSKPDSKKLTVLQLTSTVLATL